MPCPASPWEHLQLRQDGLGLPPREDAPGPSPGCLVNHGLLFSPFSLRVKKISILEKSNTC